MKRIAFAAATAALLGTGCISNSTTTYPPPDNTGAIDFSWQFIRWTTGGSTVAYGCATAQIDNVVVSFDVGGDVVVSCADQAGDGAFIAGVAAGTRTIGLTGRRGGDALFQSDPITVSVAVGQTTSTATVPVYGIPDNLAVYANFVGQYGSDMGWRYCADVNVQTLEYTIIDIANTVVATGTVPCTDPAGVSFTGATALDRDNYAIRFRAFRTGTSGPILDSATTAVAPVCDGQAFDHLGNDAWDVYLYNVMGNSTFCL